MLYSDVWALVPFSDKTFYNTFFFVIRNLHHLETPGDPAWECLGAQHSNILHLLMNSRDSHLNRELTDHDLGAGKGSTPSSVGGSSRNSTPAAKYNKIMMSSVGEWQVLLLFLNI